MDLRKYAGSPLYNADKIPVGVKIEEIVAGFETREFEDGVKAVMQFESGMGVVLNPTRTLVLTQAFGCESENVIGQAILVSRGMTTYSGKPVACVAIEAVNPVRLVAQSAAKPALEGQRPAIGKIEEAKTAQPARKGGAANDDSDIPF
jgi:hypothetical protein